MSGPVDRGHRRPRRFGQVDPVPGPGRPPRPRSARHRCHVPVGGLGRSSNGTSTATTATRWPRWPAAWTSTVGDRVLVDGTDVTDAIRGPEVSAAVSAVAANPAVRSRHGRASASVGRPPTAARGRRRAATSGRWSCLTPTLKLFLTADAGGAGGPAGKRRAPMRSPDGDDLDSTRAASPLEVPDGARVIDTGAAECRGDRGQGGGMVVSPDGTVGQDSRDKGGSGKRMDCEHRGPTGTSTIPTRRVDTRFTPIYRFLRVGGPPTSTEVVFRTHGSQPKKVRYQPVGPVIIAPVHRSFIDFFVDLRGRRPETALHGQGLLVEERPARPLLPSVGAFPVHRESADREALRRAQQVLDAGEVLILFPEGERRAGPVMEDLHEGVAFLAARTGRSWCRSGSVVPPRSCPRAPGFPSPPHPPRGGGDHPHLPSASGSGPGAPQPDPHARRGADLLAPGPLRPLGRGHRPLLISRTGPG